MKIVAGALLMMAAGCAAAPPEDIENVPVKGGSAPPCDAAPAQHLVGRPATQELGAEALRLTGAASLRWIPKDGMVTMDYREDRLNIELDGENKVVKVRCG
ncbi:MAG: I78 family peptidase inhibitor [Allosphingosinicella sp.]